MNPNEWLKQMEDICINRDWDALSALRLATNQFFANNADYAGLRAFYSQVLAAGLNVEQANKVTIGSIETFQFGVAQALNVAQHKLSALCDIKAIYFEYFFDGGDSCTGDIFLCEAYSDVNDYWGGEFREEGIVEGPDVSAYLNFDPDYQWDDVPRYIADEYANGMLLAAVIEEWVKSSIKGLPLGFANHDHEMVRVRAN